MSSRNFLKHTVSTSQPPTSGTLGDEWFNPTTNKLFKLVANSGVTVKWVEVGAGAAATAATTTASYTTTDVTEGVNLYFTNARVQANVFGILPFYTGNVNAGNVVANTIIGNGAGGTITGATLISSNNMIANTITANAIYSNVFTGNIVGSQGGGFIIGANLISSNIMVANTITANAFISNGSGPGATLFSAGNIAITSGGNLVLTGNVIYSLASNLLFYGNNPNIVSAGNLTLASNGNLILASNVIYSLTSNILLYGRNPNIVGASNLTIATAGNIFLSPEGNGKLYANTALRFASYPGITAIVGPGAGDTVYNTLSGALVFYNGATWANIGGSSGGAGGAISITNDTTVVSNAYYPMLSTITTGTLATANTSSTKLYFNPSSGTLNSTIFNSLSDRNHKTNIAPIVNALSKVLSLNGVTFNFIDGGESSAGLIAQDVLEVLPTAVKYDITNNVLSLNYSGVIGLLVEAIKEQQVQIEELKQLVNK
jgi:hypothetical protein